MQEQVAEILDELITPTHWQNCIQTTSRIWVKTNKKSYQRFNLLLLPNEAPEPVAQWLNRLPSNQEFGDSIPSGV